MFLTFISDNFMGKEKFIYSASKDIIKLKLKPFQKEVQANDWDDIIEEDWVKYFVH